MKRSASKIVSLLAALSIVAMVGGCTVNVPSHGKIVEEVEFKYAVTHADAWRVVDAFLAQRGFQEVDGHGAPTDESHYDWKYMVPGRQDVAVLLDSAAQKGCLAIAIRVPKESQDFREARDLRDAFAELARRQQWTLESHGFCAD